MDEPNNLAEEASPSVDHSSANSIISVVNDVDSINNSIDTPSIETFDDSSNSIPPTAEEEGPTIENAHDVDPSTTSDAVSTLEVETVQEPESPHVVESVVEPLLQSTETEPLEAVVVPDVASQPPLRASMEEVQAYLTTKIIGNQCTSHAQEIHEYLTTQWTLRELEHHLPIILQHITTYFTTQTKDELSLEIQSSLCIIEQMFLTIGRSTPLQDMYTEEEQELLYQLN